jgi:UDP-N-acetylglucosamine---dolichyl-phosphate N-acetylglucosaminyltransferase
MAIGKSDCFIVIAAYNETAHIAGVVKRVREQGYRNIIVVDDGSRDDTRSVAAKAGAIALRHMVNLGKGAAMKTGCDYAVREGARAIILVDGDGQHNPEELPKFLKALQNHDIVFSYRKKTGKAPLVRKMGGQFINLLFKLFYRIRLQDSICGYRAMTAAAYRKVRWNSRDYSVESEIIARAGNAGLRYTEVPIATVYHDKYKGMTVIDGVAVLWNLFWWRLTL